MVKTILGTKKWSFPLYFVLARGPKVIIQRKHFPCELRADLYIFGISRARRMGLATVLIQIPTFVFFAPHMHTGQMLAKQIFLLLLLL